MKEEKGKMAAVPVPFPPFLLFLVPLLRLLFSPYQELNRRAGEG